MINKLTSRRFLAALFSMAMIFYIVFTDKSDFSGLATILAGIIGVWIGAESYTKKGYMDNHKEQ